MTAGRTARMGGLAAAYSAIVLVCAIALAVLSARHPVRFDLTRDRHQSLKAETKRIVASIPKDAPPVEILAITSFQSGGGNAQEAERQITPLLALFEKESRSLTTHLIFAESEPQVVQSLAIDTLPVVILRWKAPGESAETPARERRTDVVTEQGIAEALDAVLAGRRGQAYLLAGHDEMQPDDQGPTGFAGAAAVLAGLNLDTHALILAGKAEIPADADLVLVTGPASDLLPDEVEALRRYVTRGGRILVMHGPSRETGRFPLLEGWLKSDWAVGVVDGIVADVDAPLSGYLIDLLVAPDDTWQHPIVKAFGKMIDINASRKLVADPYPPDGVEAALLFSSGPRSWLETDFTTPTPHYDETDLRGPHALAIAARRRPSGQEKEARLVVFGSRLFASNLGIGQVGNRDLLRNVVSWLTGHEADIASRVGTGEDGTVVIAKQQAVLILGSTLAIPLIVIVAGLATWWWRRRL